MGRWNAFLAAARIDLCFLPTRRPQFPPGVRLRDPLRGRPNLGSAPLAGLDAWPLRVCNVGRRLAVSLGRRAAEGPLSKSKQKRLSPARNGAAYPTLKDLGLDRRFALASVGAAALAVGMSCSLAGDPPTHWDPRDASVDASVPSADSGIGLADSGFVLPPSDAGEDPDGGAAGGDS